MAVAKLLCPDLGPTRRVLAADPVERDSMRLALTLAWSEDGGHVVGLAPTAAAAAVLGGRQGSLPRRLRLTWF